MTAVNVNMLRDRRALRRRRAPPKPRRRRGLRPRATSRPGPDWSRRVSEEIRVSAQIGGRLERVARRRRRSCHGRSGDRRHRQSRLPRACGVRASRSLASARQSCAASSTARGRRSARRPPRCSWRRRPCCRTPGSNSSAVRTWSASGRSRARRRTTPTAPNVSRGRGSRPRGSDTISINADAREEDRARAESRGQPRTSPARGSARAVREDLHPRADRRRHPASAPEGRRERLHAVRLAGRHPRGRPGPPCQSRRRRGRRGKHRRRAEGVRHRRCVRRSPLLRARDPRGRSSWDARTSARTSRPSGSTRRCSRRSSSSRTAASCRWGCASRRS